MAISMYTNMYTTFEGELAMEAMLTISQARSQLLDLPKKLSRDKSTKSVTVTRRGKPVLAIVDWDMYESILETLEIMGDAELMAALRQGIKEADAGKTIPIEKAFRQLGP